MPDLVLAALTPRRGRSGDHRRYASLASRLREAGFGPDTNEMGNLTRQRWQVDGPPKVTVDLLIAPTTTEDRDGRIKDIERDFAAIVAPGLRLAFRDRAKVVLDGMTIRHERARREPWVCGPGAFVAMKALALRSRGENKDACDLAYLVRNHGAGVEAIATALHGLCAGAGAPETALAVRYLDEDFATVDSIGPRRAAEFLFGGHDAAAAADAWGSVRDLIERLSEPDHAT
ncbi:MAG: hypothetical protein HY908_17485 [Myxococcales bacterium]|nr:hypothetical protein [Myxococcales bacterium]